MHEISLSSLHDIFLYVLKIVVFLTTPRFFSFVEKTIFQIRLIYVRMESISWPIEYQFSDGLINYYIYKTKHQLMENNNHLYSIRARTCPMIL